MDKTKKLLADCAPPAVGYKEKQYSQHTNYSPLPRRGKVRAFDAAGRYVGDTISVRGARRLTQAIAGKWIEVGIARCPCCDAPGMVITQDSGGTVSVDCPEKCEPASIHAVLLKLGIAVTDMWMS
jgi:hypothetical protein